MRAVTKRRLPSVFAAAKVGLAGFFRLEHQGLEAGFFMAAITKRLLCASSAGAPGIGLAFHELDGVWLSLFDDWFTHYSTQCSTLAIRKDLC